MKVERYKCKKIEKTLNTSLCICYIGEKKMQKVVQVGQTRYFVESEDDLISVTHELARKGFTVEKIASLLGVSVRKVRRYLESC
ncbi:hypothetical protein [Sulfolobus islandicus rod-shaped virus 2]|uniref:Resolvase HTH domain-containing protein n=1 Tax=Sulfolobus islandicus rod-shaped virus 2 TaxID=157899 RepID=Q8UYE8_SIRV2|nr:terminase small subunit [Sulfolobus islandicus rod-shaped virus 2]NP_666588.1 terminase small subunit [Sulfolobus islandicus rod-shaped virus 2]CAC87276.1 hypothetical protein [Sulfolobus islandicus rod-shaped virus 2]CAC87329.1 hypothetical protein [Sulfolobus islandicus rod-shaped virus 2]